MKSLPYVLVIFMTVVSSGFGEEASTGLSVHVEGVAPSYDIVTKHDHPVSYLRSLKVNDTAAILDGQARYELARTLLDVHHLCQALSHQGYTVEADECPILILARTNFYGFEKCNGEGGYSTSRWSNYFESGQIDWGVSSTFKGQTKQAGQRGGGQPAIAAEPE